MFPHDSYTEAKSSIERSGVHLVKDAEEPEHGRDTGKGGRFAQFYNDGYYTKTPEGLEFIYQNTIGDNEIWPIVSSIIKQPRWGYLRFFSTRLTDDYAWFFHNRNIHEPEEAIHTLMVQFWMPGSKVVFYQGSQLLYFDAKEDKDNYGVLNTNRLDMKREGVVPVVEDMPNGGYTIIDSRMGWTYEAGEGFMNIGLGEDREVQEWDPMQLPDTQALRAKVAELERRGLSTKFVFTQAKSRSKA